MTIDDKLLVADVVAIINVLVLGELTDEEHGALRARAALLRARISQRMRVFAAYPLSRAACLLSECLDNDMLLGR